MDKTTLWGNETEIQFFTEALKNFASVEQLFYNLESGYYAYVPKDFRGKGQTLQSRNSLIGQFSEKWARDLVAPIANHFGLYAVNNVTCDQIGLSKKSNADLALCTTNSLNQRPENIRLIFEIKMSVISNYRHTGSNSISFAGDYKTHKGNPGLLRSDSMLKAIGKSINMRVSGVESTKIPIIVLGNSPIADSYVHKVDFLKTAGVMQGFWSLNPNPTDSEHIRQTPKTGFQTIGNIKMLNNEVKELLSLDMNYFSSMLSKKKLGEFIRIANKKDKDKEKAEKLLKLIRGV